MFYYITFKLIVLFSLCISDILGQNTEQTNLADNDFMTPESTFIDELEDEDPMIICKEPGHFPHPLKCHKYYQCRLYRRKVLFMVLYDCQDGMIYDPNSQTCNIPEDINPKPNCWFIRNYSTEFYKQHPPPIEEEDIEVQGQTPNMMEDFLNENTNSTIFLTLTSTSKPPSTSVEPSKVTTLLPVLIPLQHITEASYFPNEILVQRSETLNVEQDVYDVYHNPNAENPRLMEPEVIELSDTIKLLEEENSELKNEIRKLRKGLEIAIKANEEMTEYLKRVKCFDINENDQNSGNK